MKKAGLIVISICIASMWSGVTLGKEKIKQKQRLGWLEYGIVKSADRLGARVTMKLDSGAKTSSMHAEDIEIFERNGKKFVRFSFDTSYDDDEDDRFDLAFERPLVREVVIKRHKKKNQVRPVVEMQICIAGQIHKGEFSLVDRSKFNYPVLLGRRLLADFAVIDPAETFLEKPRCN